jgi:tRNA threonylcarbamoyladenosine biosynthesis protein TsaB
MAYILHIETSTDVCSVALSDNTTLLASRESKEEKSHASKLTVFIEEVLKDSNCEITNLSAVAVSMGPGSYTGLRIGVSVAKGICYGAGIPLISVNTLEIIARMALEKMDRADLSQHICPMIDARRMEVYRALYDLNFNILKPVEASIIDEINASEWFERVKTAICGNGSSKLSNLITHQNAMFVPDIYPSAKFMIAPAYEKFTASDFENSAYFEPFYLKDFIAKPAKKLL